MSNGKKHKLIKVCGMRDTTNIAELAQLPIDYMGFILYPKSLRYIFKTQNAIRAVLPKTIQKTAVSVNLSFELLIDIVSEFKFHAVQVHGKESAEYCNSVRKALPTITIFKAIGVDTHFDFNSLNDYQNEIDYFLFDTKSDAHGGTGKKFSWHVLDNYIIEKPFFLSGGIGAEDSESLKLFNHPQCVGFDINSRFEIEPALKNIESVKNFIEGTNKN